MLDELQYIKPNSSFSVEKLRVTTDFERDFTGLMLPSPTTTYENTDHCECDGLFYFRKHAAFRLRFMHRQVRFISAAGRCFIRRSRASFFTLPLDILRTETDFYGLKRTA